MIIGLTGGIGSGKTAVSDLFAQKGITIVDADIASRQVVEPGSEALGQIAKHFGQDIINSDGTLNRGALRQQVFENESERLWLESLLHPLIRKELSRQINESTSPYTILVSPLLLESGQVEMVNRILVVDTSPELQISRTISRDNTNESSVKAIMQAQLERDQRLSRADDIIVNDSDLNHLKNEVDKLHLQYLDLAA